MLIESGRDFVKRASIAALTLGGAALVATAADSGPKSAGAQINPTETPKPTSPGTWVLADRTPSPAETLGLKIPTIEQIMSTPRLTATPTPTGPEWLPLGMIRLPGNVLDIVEQGQAQLVAVDPPDERNQPLFLTFILKRTPAEQAAFQKYQDNLNNTPANERKFLTAEQLADQFGPSMEVYNSVLEEVIKDGSRSIEISKDRLTIGAVVTRGQAETAFVTPINDYQLGNNRFYANAKNPAVSAGIAPSIQAILGLNNASRPRPVTGSVANITELSAQICTPDFYLLSLPVTPPRFFGVDNSRSGISPNNPNAPIGNVDNCISNGNYGGTFQMKGSFYPELNSGSGYPTKGSIDGIANKAGTKTLFLGTEILGTGINASNTYYIKGGEIVLDYDNPDLALRVQVTSAGLPDKGNGNFMPASYVTDGSTPYLQRDMRNAVDPGKQGFYRIKVDNQGVPLAGEEWVKVDVAVAGRNFGISSDLTMNWLPGMAMSLTMMRLYQGVFGIAPGGQLPGTAVAYTDQTSLTDFACYILLIHNQTGDDRSPVYCINPALRGGTTQPRNLKLNAQGSVAELGWTVNGNPSQMAVLRQRPGILPGQEIVYLDGLATGFSDDTGGNFACYIPGELSGSNIIGFGPEVCVDTAFSTLR